MVVVADSLNRLQAVGLIHRVEGAFVKATRAALYLNRLETA